MGASEYLSSKVEFYAERVLKDLDLWEPPIMLKPILEYFGIQLHRIENEQEVELEKRCGHKLIVPALLIRSHGETHIFVKGSDSEERQRLSVFHECGHFDIPWHRDLDYICDCGKTKNREMELREREAFKYAEFLMFPREIFRNDVRSMSTSIDTIRVLSKRYRASFEATAIRYTKYHPGICSIIYLENNPNVEETGKPFRVRYASKSKRFQHWISSQYEVAYHNLLGNCFYHRFPDYAEIPAELFGIPEKRNYLAEARPYGWDNVCVLLTIKEPQISLL